MVLGMTDIIKSLCLRNSKLNNKLSLIQTCYNKILIQFDWLNFLKNQIDLQMLREAVFSKDQRNVMALCLNFKENETIYVRVFIIYF
jgi:hypothetical protein